MTEQQVSNKISPPIKRNLVRNIFLFFKRLARGIKWIVASEQIADLPVQVRKKSRALIADIFSPEVLTENSGLKGQPTEKEAGFLKWFFACEQLPAITAESAEALNKRRGIEKDFLSWLFSSEALPDGFKSKNPGRNNNNGLK